MGSFKQSIGLRLQKAYTALPFGWKFRLAVKNVLFTLCAPFIRNTNVFKRWQAFNNMRAPESLPLISPGLDRVGREEEVAESSVLHRYVEDLMRRTATAHGTDYVAMPTDIAPPSACAAKAIAFYLPQFHPIAENDKWWGRGFTEWTNVSKALPQFVGHYQPHLPGELGFYDLRLVEVLRRQAELARTYGLHGFCFHHYWFSGYRLLERPLDMLLENPDIDLPFCLCWANENWTRRWDGQDDDVLLGQDYTADNDLNFIRDALPYLRDKRYIAVNGRPLLIVYRPSLLPDCKGTLETWREFCRAQGLGEIFIAMVQFDLEDPRPLGFDAALEFPPHKVARNLNPINHKLQVVNGQYSGYVVDYADLVDSSVNWPAPPYPLFKGVAPSWDNEARKPGRGYTFANSTPALYRQWLGHAVDYAVSHPVEGEKIVFVNAWNEWAEGAHLEPDRRFGYAYLQATRDALDAGEARGKVLVVSHDAHPHGAQYLALNLVRELKHGLKLEVEVLLMGPGRLEEAFESLAKVHRLYVDKVDVDDLFSRLQRRGFTLALANTAVAGRIVPGLKRAGMKVVTMVHELPGVIRQYGLERAVVDLARDSDRVVAGSAAVREGLVQFIGHEAASGIEIRPQGLFTRSRYRGSSGLAEPRKRLRDKLKLSDASKVVLTVGYADKRKGVDLLARAAVRCCAADPALHFVWVGHRDIALEEEVDSILRGTAAAGRFHFAGLDFDTDDYYAGADLYALPSREDPFPSVVLESLSVGIPVLAFAGTGGGADLLAAGCGRTVPAFDVEAYASALRELLHDEAVRETMGRTGRALVDENFSFRGYAMELVRLGGMELARVSVVVPNYNYAHYLKERLDSVSQQTWPLYEIIVLDDGSTDGSVEMLGNLRGGLHPEPRVVVNGRNSGSVFRQWLKGVELARGDYVWIAEADDLSKPEFVERLVRAMQADKSIVMGYCQSEQIDAYGQVLAPDYLAYTNDLSSTRWLQPYTAQGSDEVDAALGVKNTIPNVSAVLFRREALLDTLRTDIEEVAGYRIAGDWLVYLKLLGKGKVLFSPESLNQHRRHGSSVTLGSAAALHYDEVARVQKTARTLFKLSPRTIESAERYAQSLRVHFGLDSDQAKSA